MKRQKLECGCEVDVSEANQVYAIKLCDEHKKSYYDDPMKYRRLAAFGLGIETTQGKIFEDPPEKPEIYVLRFNLNLFAPKFRPVVRRYLDREISDHQAAKELRQTRESWERHIAGIFSIATNPDTLPEPFLASIEKEEEKRRFPAWTEPLTFSELQAKLSGTPMSHIQSVWHDAKPKEEN